MKYRCHSQSQNNHYAKNYRDKGIRVCEEWRNSFEAFKKWAVANGYQDGLSIDRIDSNGDYEPNNCRWITVSENSIRANGGRRKGNKKTLVDCVREIASRQGLSIADVEKMAGLSENSIYRWDRTDPGHSKVVAVADALGISLDELRGRRRNDKGR